MKIYITSLIGLFIIFVLTLGHQHAQEQKQLGINVETNNADQTLNVVIPSVTDSFELPETVEAPRSMIAMVSKSGLDLVISEDHLNMADVTPIVAWSEPRLDANEPAFDVSETVTEKQRVSFNNDSMNSMAAGKKIAFPMPSGEEYVANMETMTTFNNGSTSWRGHLDGYGDQYPVVFTAGNTATFATITTPEGSFTLESVDGEGWVYKNPEINELDSAGHQDSLVASPIQKADSI